MVGAGEVQVQTAGRGRHGGHRAGEQTGTLGPVELRPPVAGGADIDIEHVGGGEAVERAGRHRHIRGRRSGPPPAHQVLIEGGTVETVTGQRFLATGPAREHRPAGADGRECGLEGRSLVLTGLVAQPLVQGLSVSVTTMFAQIDASVS